jgi:hypothetical protein
MRVSGGGEPEGFLKGDLPGSVIEEIRSPDDVGDALKRIVHHDRELISEGPVAPADDHIPEARELEAGAPLRPILEANTSRSHPQARRGRPGPAWTKAAGTRIRPIRGSIAAAAAAFEGEPVCAELGQRAGVVHRARTLILDRAVPGEAEGLERAQHPGAATCDDPPGVEILDAHQPPAAARTRIEVAADRSEQGA